MKSFKRRSMWFLVVLLLGYISIVSVSCMSSPKNIGLIDGKLHPCPDSPNCVSSQSSDEAHKVEPLTYKGDAVKAKKKLKEIITNMPRMNIVVDEPLYMHVESTTLIFRFVDDCEFLIDDQQKIIHVRSASRVGYSDLGVNRKRVESIREEFNKD